MLDNRVCKLYLKRHFFAVFLFGNRDQVLLFCGSEKKNGVLFLLADHLFVVDSQPVFLQLRAESLKKDILSMFSSYQLWLYSCWTVTGKLSEDV